MAVMVERETDTLSERDEIEALLPWYVAGKLDVKSRAKVERYAEAHPEIDAHIAMAREESDATIAANEAIPAPGPRALDRLRASIAAHPRRKPFGAVLEQMSERFADWIAGLAPPKLALVAAAAALIVMLQAAAIGALVLDRAGSPTYHTAGGEQSAGEGAELLVGFSDQATIGEITALLKQVDALMVDGPKAGLYRVRLPGKDAEGAKAATELLLQSGIVTTVLPEG
jgi:anti-sigma factor RsiW